MQLNGLLFNYSLSDILEELQRQLKLNGIQLLQITRDTSNDIMVQCPYHKNGQERKPSAGISKEDGTLHCFACGEVHSLAEVISHCFGKDDNGSYGWNWLLKNFVTVSVEDRPRMQLNLSRDHSKEQKQYVSEKELDSYRYVHPYMYKRRLTDEVIEMFDVGYDSNTDCITFPVRDINGNTLFIARRSTKTKLFNYPQGVEKPVYGLYEIRRVIESRELSLDWMDEFGVTHEIPKKKLWHDNIQTNEIIICESIIDALTCWVYGKPAVALNGLGTERQFNDLRRFPCRKYIIATDMDKAGLNSRIRIKKALSKEKLVTEYVWDLNTAKDINDMDYKYFSSLEEYF